MCVVFRKSACPFGQVKTKMHLPEGPFFQKSLAGASGLVLMSVPVADDTFYRNSECEWVNNNYVTLYSDNDILFISYITSITIYYLDVTLFLCSAIFNEYTTAMPC